MPSTPVPLTVFSDDNGDVPPTTPRATSTTRAHGDDADDHESKRARVETSKKQRVKRVAEMAILVVKVSSEEEFHTMDDYEFDLIRTRSMHGKVKRRCLLQRCLQSCGQIMTQSAASRTSC